jgi:hypothetical protein
MMSIWHPNRPKTVTTNTRNDQVEVIRERKALKAAQLDRAIEKELLERLRQVSETEIYNYPEKQYSKALKRASSMTETEEEDGELLKETSHSIRRRASQLADDDEEEELEDEDEDEETLHEVDHEATSDDDDNLFNGLDANYNVEYVEDFEESDEEDGDLEDIADNLPSSSSFTSTKKSVSFLEPDSDAGKLSYAYLSNNYKLMVVSVAMAGSSSRKRKQSSDPRVGKKSFKPKKRVPHVEIEYEDEDNEKMAETLVN